MQFYTDPSRENDPHALPNAEVFWPDDDTHTVGYYWWPCFPGCLPDGEAIGPFDTQVEAIADAQED